MALTSRQWQALAPLMADRLRVGSALAKKVGGEAALTELLELGHVARGDGRKLFRTKASVDAFALFEALPEDGTGMGNGTAQRVSGLSARRYERARSLLLASGEISRGRGRGGSIRRVELGDSSRGGASRESELYDPLRDLISAEEDLNATFRVVRVTANGAGGRQRGEWTRPDLVSVTVQTYSLLPDIVLEVSSFEVKPRWAADKLVGVYEASAHQRQAHYSTLVIEWPADDDPPDVVVQESARLGVGLATMQVDEVLDWVVMPERNEPDPSLVQELLREALSDDQDHAAYLRAIGKARLSDEQGIS